MRRTALVIALYIPYFRLSLTAIIPISLDHEIQIYRKLSFIKGEETWRCLTWLLEKSVNDSFTSVFLEKGLVPFEVFQHLFREALDLILGERYVNHFLRFTTCDENCKLLSMIRITCGFGLWNFGIHFTRIISLQCQSRLFILFSNPLVQ